MENILFTGKGIYQKPQDTGRSERAAIQAGEAILSAARTKLDNALAAKKDFRALMDIDPVQLVSIKATEEQMKQLEAFNQKYTDLYAKRKGKLTIVDEMNIMRDKAALQNNQNKWLAKQKQVQADWETVQNPRNWDVYDISAWTESYRNFLETGEYQSETALQPATPSDQWVLTNFKIPNATTTQTEEKVKDGKLVYKQVGTKEEAQALIWDIAFEPSGRGMKWMIKKFNELPKDVQKKYLESEPAGGWEPSMHENPIVRAVQEEYWQMFIKKTDAVKVPMTSSTEKPKSELQTFYAGGSSYKYVPPESNQRLIGDEQFNDFYEFTRAPSNWTFAVDEGRILDTYFSEGSLIEQDEFVTEGNRISGVVIKGQLIGYDKEKDEFVFNVADNYRGTSFHKTGAGDKIAVPRSAVQDQFGDLKIKVDGKIVKISDIKPEKTKSGKVIPYLEWIKTPAGQTPDGKPKTAAEWKEAMKVT